MGKRLLIIGSGGREAALVKKLSEDAAVECIYCAPGNDGMETIDACVKRVPELSVDHHEALANFAQESNVDLTIVGPEAPLANGIVDAFTAAGLRIVGPTKDAARLESSKAYCKDFLRRHNIRTPDFAVFDDPQRAYNFISRQPTPIVVKADGLAGGKGVTVAHTRDEAKTAVNDIMVKQVFGAAAGQSIIIEKFLTGRECSVMALTDGTAIYPFLPAQDYKRAQEGDQGQNTGGMGSFAPLPVCDRTMRYRILNEILYRTIGGLRHEGCLYRGILYAGLMLTPEGPSLLEFNCRFGDPEIQALLALLDVPLLPLLDATVDNTVNTLLNRGPLLFWRCNRQAVCLVLASRGYPGKYETGLPITGLDKAADHWVQIIHAGTKHCPDEPKRWLTNGGRVLNLVAVAPTFAEARQRVYAAAEDIAFGDRPPQYRTDIASYIPTTL